MVGNWIWAPGRAGQCPLPSGIRYFLPCLPIFLACYYLKKSIGFFLIRIVISSGQPLRFKMSDFLIRMWSNFPKPFRLVRKTLLISFLSIWHDLVRRESSYAPGCSENQSFCSKPKVDFPVVCWIFDYWIFQNDPSPRGPHGRATLVKYFL